MEAFQVADRGAVKSAHRPGFLSGVVLFCCNGPAVCADRGAATRQIDGRIRCDQMVGAVEGEE